MREEKERDKRRWDKRDVGNSFHPFSTLKSSKRPKVKSRQGGNKVGT